MNKKYIHSIWDNGGETADRYCIVFRAMWGRDKLRKGASCSENPSHPQGVWCYGPCMPGDHLGKRITWGDLPAAVQLVLEWYFRGRDWKTALIVVAKD